MADAQPKTGSPPTAEEKADLTGVFPKLKGQPFTITDRSDRKGAYNCWSYAVGCTRFLPSYEPPFHNPERARALEKSLADNGWQPAADCKRKKGFRKLALYCSNVPKRGRSDTDLSGHDILHAAKELIATTWWESKDGEKYRFTHPTPESIEGGKFDHLCGCYEKPLEKVLEDAKSLVQKIKRARKAFEPPKTQLDRDIVASYDTSIVEAEQTVRDVEARIKADK
jgi:hypothetical protein